MPNSVFRAGVVLALVWAATAGWAQDQRALVALPVAGAAGLGFDSTTSGTLKGVLVGFLIPSTGPLTALSPLTAELGADGTLGKSQPGPWAGTMPAHPLRIEKPGYAVAGLRLLVTVDGSSVRTRQMQIFWKPWTDGALGAETVESRVYGEKAGEKDTVKIVELRVPPPAWATGVYGTTDGPVLAQFSLVLRSAPAADVKPAKDSSRPATPGPRAPTPPSLPTPSLEPVVK